MNYKRSPINTHLIVSADFSCLARRDFSKASESIYFGRQIWWANSDMTRIFLLLQFIVSRSAAKLHQLTLFIITKPSHYGWNDDAKVNLIKILWSEIFRVRDGLVIKHNKLFCCCHRLFQTHIFRWLLHLLWRSLGARELYTGFSLSVRIVNVGLQTYLCTFLGSCLESRINWMRKLFQWIHCCVAKEIFQNLL